MNASIPTTAEERALRRRPDQAMIGGVCQGLSDYFGLNVTLVRAVFVGLTAFNGFGLLAYIALVFLMDVDRPGSKPVDDTPEFNPVVVSDVTNGSSAGGG